MPKPSPLPNLRTRRQKSGKVYFYYDTGRRPRKEIPLGSDYLTAVRKWAELERVSEAPPTLFPQVVEAYLRDEISALAAKTQREYGHAIRRLMEFFGAPPAPVGAIATHHVYRYLDQHKDHPVQAARDKATLSTILEYARRRGYLRGPNPCAGVRAKGGKARRTVYTTDDVLRAVYEAACEPLQDALDVAYAIGQRPADVLKVSESDVRDGMLHVRQNKTGVEERFRITGRLQRALARSRQRKQGRVVRPLALLVNERGRALTESMLRGRFDKARKTAAAANPALAEQIRQMWFVDMRPKAVTDRAEERGVAAAQRMAGHANVATTGIYVRSSGDVIEPNE
jgi:integrase